MEKEKLDLLQLATAAKDGKVVIEIREGQAAKLLDPIKPIEKKQLSIAGVIGTVFEFLSKRRLLFLAENSQLKVNVNEGFIIFFGNECDDNENLKTTVVSQLELTDTFKELEINTDREFETLELSRFLRKRKLLFTDSDQYLKVWNALSCFQGEISKRIEKADDRSGNATRFIKQELTSNMPKEFQLKVQVFENTTPILIDVEIDVNPDNLKCSLISYRLDEDCETLKKSLIEGELNSFLFEDFKLRDFCITYYC